MEEIQNILQQLNDLKQEYEDREQSVYRLEEYIAKLEEEGYTQIDSVSGGNGGKQHYKIEGYPYPLYTKKKSQLLERKLRLEKLKEKIGQQINLAEEYICMVDNSRIRRLLTYRYVEGLSWESVADKMSDGSTGKSCQKAVERHLKKIYRNF